MNPSYKLNPRVRMDDVRQRIQERLRNVSQPPQQYAQNAEAQPSYPGQAPSRISAYQEYLGKYSQ